MSIRAKLVIMCMTTSLLSLLISSGAIYVHEIRSLGAQLENQYLSLASAASPLTAAALDFLDESSAREVLVHLGEDPDIVGAAIYDADGKVFVAYSRDANVYLPPTFSRQGHWYQDRQLYIFQPVESMGEHIGTIFLQVRVSAAEQRALAYAGVVLGVMGLSILATYFFASFFVRVFSRPIVELAETTKRVTVQKNYRIRAEKTTSDELGDLIDSFNEMLNQIEERDSQLEDHRNILEGEVAARTEEIRKFALAVEQSPNTTLITDTEGNVEYVNHQFTQSTGYTVDEAMSADPSIMKAGLLPVKEKRELLKTLERGEEWRGEFRNLKKSGEIMWESASVAPLRTAAGKITHHVWIKEDITERKRSEQALRESEDRYALAAQGANDGLWDWDLRSDTVYFSARWKSMLGYAEDEVEESPSEWFRRVDSRDLETVRKKLDEHLRGESPHFEHEYRMVHKDGSCRWMLSRGVAVLDEGGKPYRFAGSQTDITDRKEAEQQLFHDASHDRLTGLPNRGLLLERLSGAVQRGKRQTEFKFSVLFLDLDRFKVINDSLGHAVGDALLIEVSRRLATCVREQDVIARLGGDEFAVLLEGIESDEDPVHVSERIQSELTRPYMLLDNEVFTSASIGIALSSHGYDKPEDILRDSDVAMYRAKSLGKARFAMFDAELHDKAIRRLQLENDLRRAVANEDLVLHYQPILDIQSERTIGFEALVRWDHAEEGLIPPGDFISIAEETGLITEMGWWILREAAEECVRWRKDPQSPDKLTVSVNISGKQFLQGDFVESLKDIMADTGILGSEMKLEVTETVIIENPTAVSEILNELRALGLDLCIDDFGTGYSSLSYLHRFPFDVLKIDRSFVSSLDTDDEAVGIVQAIVGLAKNLGLYITAEGIETEGQLKRLRDLDCDSAQGYYFAKPMDAAKIHEYFAQRGELREAPSTTTAISE